MSLAKEGVANATALAMSVVKNNLFNFIQTASPLVGYEDPNFEPGFSPYFDTAYAYAPNHGIEFYLGFKWDLAKKETMNLVSEK